MASPVWLWLLQHLYDGQRRLATGQSVLCVMAQRGPGHNGQGEQAGEQQTHGNGATAQTEGGQQSEGGQCQQAQQR